jgi:aspartyl-tRNA synthetase
MDPEGERQISTYVAEVLEAMVVFLTDYASGIRPFHHMRRRPEHHQGTTSSSTGGDLNRRPA